MSEGTGGPADISGGLQHFMTRTRAGTPPLVAALEPLLCNERCRAQTQAILRCGDPSWPTQVDQNAVPLAISYVCRTPYMECSYRRWKGVRKCASPVEEDAS